MRLYYKLTPVLRRTLKGKFSYILSIEKKNGYDLRSFQLWFFNGIDDNDNLVNPVQIQMTVMNKTTIKCFQACEFMGHDDCD